MSHFVKDYLGDAWLRWKAIQSERMNWFGTKKKLGMLLLAIWLIASGVISLVHINFPLSDLLLAALAIVAGVLLLIDR